MVKLIATLFACAFLVALSLVFASISLVFGLAGMLFPSLVLLGYSAASIGGVFVLWFMLAELLRIAFKPLRTVP